MRFFKKKEEYSSQSRFPLWKKGGVCDACGNSIKGVTAFLVPNNVFYDSKEWREYFHKTNPYIEVLSKVLPDMSDDEISDEQIRRMRKDDKSNGSAICENCIHMFE
jgi:hypothetical protein